MSDHFREPADGFEPPAGWAHVAAPSPSWSVWRVPVTGSTNADLLAAAALGAPDRTVLVTDHQTAGRGRLDRTWDAPPGANLLVSILFRDVPDPPVALTHRVGLAAIDAVRRVAGTAATLEVAQRRARRRPQARRHPRPAGTGRSGGGRHRSERRLGTRGLGPDRRVGVAGCRARCPARRVRRTARRRGTIATAQRCRHSGPRCASSCRAVRSRAAPSTSRRTAVSWCSTRARSRIGSTSVTSFTCARRAVDVPGAPPADTLDPHARRSSHRCATPSLTGAVDAGDHGGHHGGRRRRRAAGRRSANRRRRADRRSGGGARRHPRRRRAVPGRELPARGLRHPRGLRSRRHRLGRGGQHRGRQRSPERHDHDPAPGAQRRGVAS